MTLQETADLLLMHGYRCATRSNHIRRGDACARSESFDIAHSYYQEKAREQPIRTDPAKDAKATGVVDTVGASTGDEK